MNQSTIYFFIVNLDWVPLRGIAQMLGISFQGLWKHAKREDSLVGDCLIFDLVEEECKDFRG